MAIFITDKDTKKYLMVRCEPTEIILKAGFKPSEYFWTNDLKKATNFNSPKEALEYLNAGLVRKGEFGELTQYLAFQGEGENVARNVSLIDNP